MWLIPPPPLCHQNGSQPWRVLSAHSTFFQQPSLIQRYWVNGYNFMYTSTIIVARPGIDPITSESFQSPNYFRNFQRHQREFYFSWNFFTTYSETRAYFVCVSLEGSASRICSMILCMYRCIFCCTDTARRPMAWNAADFSLLDFSAPRRNTTVSSRYLQIQ